MRQAPATGPLPVSPGEETRPPGGARGTQRPSAAAGDQRTRTARASRAREQVLGQQRFLAPGHEQARRLATEAGCDLNVLFKGILTQMEAATVKWGTF